MSGEIFIKTERRTTYNDFDIEVYTEWKGEEPFPTRRLRVLVDSYLKELVASNECVSCDDISKSLMSFLKKQPCCERVTVKVCEDGCAGILLFDR